MVLGCYYLTADNPNYSQPSGQYFASMDDVAMAFEQGMIHIHAQVWVRFDGEVETDYDDSKTIEEIDQDGFITKVYKAKRVREDKEGNLISQYILTTPGRVILNKAIQDVLAFS
jgi:DNA-directed RNA polymerase subunit beta'